MEELPAVTPHASFFCSVYAPGTPNTIGSYAKDNQIILEVDNEP